MIGSRWRIASRKPQLAIFRSTRRFKSEEHASDRVPVIKDAKYYEEQQVLRRYYYVIDTRGGTFLEDTIPRNIATSLKDRRFLEFFHKQIRRNTTGIHEEIYPYVSLCGKELNFILPLDPHSAFVYTELSTDNRILYYGGRVGTVPSAESGSGSDASIGKSFGSAIFDPRLLSFNSETGRLYYPIINHKYINRNLDASTALDTDYSQLEYGLLHPHLCQQLGVYIDYDNDNSRWCFSWAGSSIVLREIG